MLFESAGAIARNIGADLRQRLSWLTVVLLGGWFLFVIVTSYGDLTPRTIRLPDVYDSNPYLDDFVVFYSAGTVVRLGGTNVYDPDGVSRVQAELTGQDPERVSVLPFFNPPWALLPLSFLSMFGLPLAAGAWLIGSFLFAVFALVRLTRALELSIPPSLVILSSLAVVSSLPFFQVMLHGQMTFLLVGAFALFASGVVGGYRRGPILMGLTLLSLKPIFVLCPLLLLLLRGQWKLAAQAALLQAVLLVFVSAIFQKPSLAFEWIQLSREATSWDEVNGISTYGMFGWTGFIRGILGPDVHLTVSLVAGIASLLTLAGLAAILRRRKEAWLDCAVIVVVSLLISPHSYAQDLLLLAVALLCLAKGIDLQRLALLALVSWFALYWHFDVLNWTGIGLVSLILIGFWALFIRQALTALHPLISVRHSEIVA